MSFEAGVGTILKIGDGADPGTATFTTVAQVTKIGNLVLETMFSDFVQHGPGNVFRERIPTIQEIGDIELELGWDESEATQGNTAGGLLHAWENKTKLAWQLIFSDGGDMDVKFVAYVGKIDIDPDPEKHIVGKCTLRPTGGPTLT